MEIREASDHDIPGIVGLLKISLGESLMPKSEAYWRWKHVLNPFGESPVLLAVDSGTIVGVRAFMRWQWKDREKVYNTTRAVDTATHPKFQGKGIFKNLTMALVAKCEKDGDLFVFNTPNEKSKAGYLKMGWQTAGKFPVRLDIRRPFSVFKNVAARPDVEDAKLKDDQLGYWLNHADLPMLIHRSSDGKYLETNVSVDYLRWRYSNVPVVNYLAVGSESGNELDGLIIGRIKVTRLGREFRMTDVFIKHNFSHKALIKKFNEKIKELNVDYTTLSGAALPAARRLSRWSTMNLLVGPAVTIRSLHEKDLSHLEKFKGWAPSLGDLELF